MIDIDKDLRKTIDHFGYESQIKKLNEECFEVIDASKELMNFMTYSPKDALAMLVDGKRYTLEAYEKKLERHLTEEIADVLNVLRQIQLYFGISDSKVEKYRLSKNERTIKKIKKDI